MEIFFDPNIRPNIKGFELNPDESLHAMKSLRFREGDLMRITDGQGSLYEASVTRRIDKQLILEVHGRVEAVSRPSALHVAVSPLKKPDRNDFLVEKCTESGMTALSYFRSAETVKQNIRAARSRKIAGSAMKQSRRLWLPEIHDIVPYEQLLNNLPDGDVFIANQADKEARPFWELYRPGIDTIIMLGPEGDFTTEEIESAKDSGAQPVWLGNYRYRTETAAMASMQFAHLLENQLLSHTKSKG